ncbi:FHA domain-containing protein [uncultured Chloroflexus sp.]|uniref:FHA domain-containing protein n=1 Tax=uncultured Chloroflexus sp. TaxID=214040 RepID=UPI00261C5CF8|nr:FHA domain-containing protein [uncultured Chloroflexus sp.]
MRRRTPLLVLLILLIVWPVLTAAHIIPPTPPVTPPRLILGVEQISATAWALLVGCSSPPHDLRVWAEEAPPQLPQTITALAPGRWRAQFDGALPSSAIVYGCGQRAALVVASTTTPLWLNSLFGLGMVAAALLGVRLIRRPRRVVTRPTPSPTTPVWQAHITDEQGDRILTLPTGMLTAGSDPACHMIVLGSDIALRHAHLMLTEEQAHIVDLASPSGIFCGPVRRRLRPHTPTLVGDEDIWLGATVRLRLVKI